LDDSELFTLWQFLQTGVAPPAGVAALRNQTSSALQPARSSSSSDAVSQPLTAAAVAQALTATLIGLFGGLHGSLSRWNFSAIPPNVAQIAMFRAENVTNSVAGINATLARLDAVTEAVIAAIPGLAQQLDVVVGNQAGPYKYAPSFTFAPQIRLSFFRSQFGLPQSPIQLLQWLGDPTLQLRTDNVEFRQELYTQTYINFVFADPPFSSYALPFILSKRRRKNRALLQMPPDRRMALDVGPFTFPNVPTLAGILATKLNQVRTMLQNWLNVRPQFLVSPFASLIPTSRTGVQVQQRVDGKPLIIQYYQRLGFDTDDAVREVASLRVLTLGSPGFISLQSIVNLLGDAYGALIAHLHALRNRGAAHGAMAPAPAPSPALEDAVEGPAPASHAPLAAIGRRKLRESTSKTQPRSEEPGISVAAPHLFPASLLPQWQQFFFDWRNLFGIGNLLDFRVFNALLTGPYTRTTVILFTPQIRVYLGQVKIGLPRTKDETEQWLRDFTEQLVTDQLSFQYQMRINTALSVVLTPTVPPRPPPMPPQPPLWRFGGRRRLQSSVTAIKGALQTTQPPWTTDDPRCAPGNFPVLYDAAAIAAIRATQNGTVKHAQWLQAMLSFATGLEELRTTSVPIACVPPMYRSEAMVEMQAQQDEAAGAPPMPTAGRRLLQSAAAGATSSESAVATARIAHNHSLLTQTALKSLAVQLQETVFATAIAELVVQSPLTASVNIADVMQPFFQPYTANLLALIETDFIAGKEALFTLLAPKAASTPPGTSPGTRLRPTTFNG